MNQYMLKDNRTVETGRERGREKGSVRERGERKKGGREREGGGRERGTHKTIVDAKMFDT